MKSNVIFYFRKEENRKLHKGVQREKLRVAAYARVSTESDEEATSYEAQVGHYTDYIQKNDH